MDRILIDDLRVLTVIGALPHEREIAQPIRIDLSIGVDLHEAGRSDELADTVHYGLVCERVTETGPRQQGHPARAAGRQGGRRGARVRPRRRGRRDAHQAAPAHPRSGAEHRRCASSAPAPRPPRRRWWTHSAIVALGSNLGDRERYLRFAVGELGNVVAMSQVFETEPVGGPDDQGAYLNMVVKVRDARSTRTRFIRRCQRIEANALRQRIVHWGPRTLDVDLLFYDDVHIASEALTVPHPRIFERRFVLAPLSEVAPELCPAGLGASAAAQRDPRPRTAARSDAMPP